MHYSGRGATRRGTGWYTLYCVYVTSRRLNLHAARERAMKYSRRRHGRHATCARTMHRTGFGCCCVPFFDLPPRFSPRGENKFRFYYVSRARARYMCFIEKQRKLCAHGAPSFLHKNEERWIKTINLTNRYNTNRGVTTRWVYDKKYTGRICDDLTMSEGSLNLIIWGDIMFTVIHNVIPL